MTRSLCVLATVTAFSTSSFGSLLVHYTFDEPSGPAINHGTLGASADGSFNGAATRSSNTPNGQGYSLNTNGGAPGDYVTAGTPPEVAAIGNQFTLVAWINLQADPSDGDGIISIGSHGSGFSWQIEKASTGNISAKEFRMDIHANYGGSLYSNDITVGDIDKWLFVAVTYKWNPWPTSRLDVVHYLGDLDTPVAEWGTGTHSSLGGVRSSNTDLRVGATTRQTYWDGPDAFIDDVRIYNEALTLEQIEAIRLSVVPEPTSMALAGISCALLVRRRR